MFKVVLELSHFFCFFLPNQVELSIKYVKNEAAKAINEYIRYKMINRFSGYKFTGTQAKSRANQLSKILTLTGRP